MTVASPVDLSTSIPKAYTPFIWSGVMSLLDSGSNTLITILRHSGAVQSLILESTLPFSNDSAVEQEVTLQGVELGHMSVPLHSVHLECDLVSGPVIVGVRPSLSVHGVSFILGNDLAGQRVTATDNGISSSTSMGVVTRVTVRKQMTEVNDESHDEGSLVGAAVADERPNVSDTVQSPHDNQIVAKGEFSTVTEEVSNLTFS